MLTNLRRGKKAQSLVIVALSATALFGIIALGLDAGRLYFQRRDVQNAADAGALAGAQELIPTQTTPIPDTTMIAAAGCQASIYALQGLLGTPTDACGSPNYIPATYGGGISEPGKNIPVTVQVWTPSRNNPNEIHVRVTYNVPLTFAAVLGFTNAPVVADAYAHGGFYNKTYTVFGFDAGGNGNSVNYDQNGNTQVDNGNNGLDICRPGAAQGKLVSNAKWHAPNPGGGWMDLNGQFYYSQASDTHALTLYWYGTAATAQGVEPIPNYEPPLKPGGSDPPYTTSSWNGKTVHVIWPGLYDHDINIPFPSAAPRDLYRFMNGIYYFQDHSLNISGGTVSNTNSGDPFPGPFGGVSDLPNAPDGTNGVEFVFDGNASFNATTSGGTSPSIFFAAPSFVSSGTDSIVFFIKSTDSISGPTGTPFVEKIDGTKPTANGFSPFQIWGSIFNADVNGSHGTGIVLQAVSETVYAVNGEVVSPQADLDGGNLPGASGAYTPSTYPGGCNASPSGYHQNTAGYLVQFNAHYVPHWRGLAYLVK
jgi:Flp pilus assembly protein TadG